MKSLLEFGADPNAVKLSSSLTLYLISQTTVSLVTPLHWAVDANQLEGEH